MALPTPVAERLSQRNPEVSSWFAQLIIFAASIFLVSLVIWAGLSFGYQPFLQRQLDQLNTDIDSMNRSIASSSQDTIITVYSQIKNIRAILDSRVLASSVFPWLEANTLPGVYYSHATISANRREIALNGVARTGVDLYSQFRNFQNVPGVQKVSFSNVVQQSGLWQFDVAITGNFGDFLPAEIPSSTMSGLLPPNLVLASSTPPEASSSGKVHLAPLPKR